jgi:hypothetical protein
MILVHFLNLIVTHDPCSLLSDSYLSPVPYLDSGLLCSPCLPVIQCFFSSPVHCLCSILIQCFITAFALRILLQSGSSKSSGSWAIPFLNRHKLRLTARFDQSPFWELTIMCSIRSCQCPRTFMRIGNSELMSFCEQNGPW